MSTRKTTGVHFRFTWAAVAVASLFGGAGTAMAADSGKAGDNVRLAPVVVTGSRVERSSFDLPMAIDAVDASVIQDQGRLEVNISEILNRVPGTTVQNRETYAQEQQISVRGFGARSQFGTRGVRLYQDGIPVSTPDGQGGPGIFALGTASRVEVLRGAFSALYGNHSGGVVQAFTENGPPQPTLGAGVTVGSYDTWRADATFGGQAGNSNYIGSVSRYDTDGYRDNSAARKDAFNAKVSYAYAPGSSVNLMLNWFDIPEAQDPLGLTAAQVTQDRQQAGTNAIAFGTRRKLDTTQAGIVLDHKLSDRDQLLALVYGGQRGNEQFLAIPLPQQNDIRQSGAVSKIERDFGGVAARWTHRNSIAGGPLLLTAGAEYDTARDLRQGYVNTLGVQGVLKRDEDNDVDSWGAYAQAEWQFLPALSATAGLRYTRVAFEVTDRFICTTTLVTAPGAAPGLCSGSTTVIGNTPTTRNQNDSGDASYSSWTPVFGLLWKATPMVNLYANYGKSFETPTFVELSFRPDQGSGPNFGLQPAESNQYEVGLKAFVGANARVTAALFHIDTEDEIVIATNLGGRASFQNAPGSERRGGELSFDGDLGAGFNLYAAYTYLSATYTDPFLTCRATPCNIQTGLGTAQVAAGNRIPGAARQTVYTQLTWRHAPLGFTTGAEAYWSGNVAVNDINSEYAGQYGVFNWWAGFEQKVGGWTFRESARVNNLTDRRYIGAVVVGDLNGRFYAPAPERNYLVGVNASYRF